MTGNTRDSDFFLLPSNSADLIFEGLLIENDRYEGLATSAISTSGSERVTFKDVSVRNISFSTSSSTFSVIKAKRNLLEEFSLTNVEYTDANCNILTFEGMTGDKNVSLEIRDIEVHNVNTDKEI